MSATIETRMPLTRTKAETARLLGTDTKAVADLIRQGTLKVIRFPWLTRDKVLQSSIDDMLTRINGGDKQAG